MPLGRPVDRPEPHPLVPLIILCETLTLEPSCLRTLVNISSHSLRSVNSQFTRVQHHQLQQEGKGVQRCKAVVDILSTLITVPAFSRLVKVLYL